jgi:transcriptional regulator of heat shock response
MADKGFKRFLPSFITIAFELMEHWKRDSAHNNNIKKLDKTNEQLGTIEHMLVRLEKKIQTNRELVDRLKTMLFVSMAANMLLLIVIFLKVFCVI